MIEEIYQKFLECSGISTDSRRIGKGNMFFALKGPNFNGNLYATKALDDGAKYAVVDEEQYIMGSQYILVEDVLNTLQQMANHHRNQFAIPFIGITGSNGKTTTKELMHAVLSKKYNTLATRGNLNNHIGVPLTLLEVSAEHDLAIIEMGANKVGDIRELCEIADPDLGMITNIGTAHIEGFGGFDGVLRGKTELYDHLIRKGGKIFVNREDEILMNMVKRMRDPGFYPEEDRLVSASPYVVFQTGSGETIKTQLVGRYNYMNLSCALRLGNHFGVEEKDGLEAVSNYIPENNRSQVMEKGSNTIILDAYNANPSSMTEAVENLDEFNSKNKAVILGDMYELGPETEEYHQQIGRLLRSKNFSRVIFCGKHMKYAHDAFPESIFFEQKEELKAYLESQPFSETTLLIKASRGMGLETLLEVI